MRSRLRQTLLKRPLSFLKPNNSLLLPSDPQAYTNLLIQQCSVAAHLHRVHHPFDGSPHRNCRIVHARIHLLGLKLVGNLGHALVDLYCKSDDLDSAQKVFDRLDEKAAPAWNSILSAHSKHGLPENVVNVFSAMHQSGSQPDQFTSAVVLTAIARMASHVGHGKIVHCQIIKTGLESNPFCQGSLINMYVKCGCATTDARRVFDGIEYPDTISSTTIMEGYLRSGDAEEALRLFSRMQDLGMRMDDVTLVTAITACVSLGRLENARDLCRRMPLPNVVAWNAIISGYAKNGYEDEAVALFREMRACDVKSTRSTFGSVLSAIASLTDLNEGLVVHSEAIKLGLDSSVFVGSSLINMYAKCHVVEDARKVFDTSGERNVVMWNSMIDGYLQNECPADTVGMFLEMKGQHDFELDEFTLVSLFGACTSLENLELGRQLHCIMVKWNLGGSSFVENAVVDMYAKSGELNDARRKFELITNKDNVSWNAIIACYAHNEGEEEAVRLFQRMRLEGAVPDEVSFASVISACSNSEALEEGTQLHCLAMKCNLGLGSYVGSSLIDMYAKLGELKDAIKVYMEMPERSVVSQNALIAGHVQNGKEQEALDLFRQMQIEGVEPSQITFASVLPACNGTWGLDMGKQIHCGLLKSGLLFGYAIMEVSLLSMYLKMKSLKEANDLFWEIPKQEKVLWTAIISGHAQIGYSEEATILFWKMRDENICSDEATFSSILKACADLASLRDGKEIHGLIIRTGFSSYRYTGSALIDMYSKCGDADASFQVFEERNSKGDIILCNPMIVGFAKNGLAEEALMLFHQMQDSKIIPDDVTFLGVLTACSHAGLVSQGRGFFNLMFKKYGVVPRTDHYACMIDLLCRGGYVAQAEDFINKLPFEPDGVIWATLLSACRVHKDERRGKHAAEKLICLEPHNSSPYVQLSNIYAASGNWGEAKMLRQAMRERGVRKSPGCSWIEVGNTTNLFVAEDKLHPSVDNIYEILKDLAMEMEEEGYVANVDCLLLDEE